MYRSKPREAGLHQPLMCAGAGILNDPSDQKGWASFAANVDNLRLDQATHLLAHLDRYVYGRQPVDTLLRALCRLPAGLSDETMVVLALLRSDLVAAVKARETAERTL